jgi:hypothetical protein
MPTLPQSEIDLTRGVVFQDQPSLTWVAGPVTHRAHPAVSAVNTGSKMILCLLHYAEIGNASQIRNTDSFRLFYDNQMFKIE